MWRHWMGLQENEFTSDIDNEENIVSEMNTCDWYKCQVLSS